MSRFFEFWRPLAAAAAADTGSAVISAVICRHSRRIEH